MEKVCIAIPIYKTNFSELEDISFQQYKKILGHHDSYFVMPEHLRHSDWQDYGLPAIFFPDEFFHNIPMYSRLMMSEEFYKAFNQYEYLLIYQLDAFAFNDRLLEFCQMGFDYIGAPHPRYGIHWNKLGQVGNGGFSLRNVEKCLWVSKNKESIMNGHPLKEKMIDAEDLFFTYCGHRKDIDFNVPNIKIATEFSISNDCYHCLDKFDTEKQFGCHAWYKGDYGFWKKIIESKGYNLPNLQGRCLLSSRKELLRTLLWKRMWRKQNTEKTVSILHDILPSHHYALYGLGNVGVQVFDYLNMAGVRVSTIYDKKMYKKESYRKVPIYNLEQISLGDIDLPIIVAIKEQMQVVCDLLNKRGLKRNKDYFVWEEIETAGLLKYYDGHGFIREILNEYEVTNLHE